MQLQERRLVLELQEVRAEGPYSDQEVGETVIKKKVTWKCREPSITDMCNSDSDSTVREDLSTTKVGCILRGLSSNFTEGGTSASNKGAVCDRLEPRLYSKRTRLC